MSRRNAARPGRLHLALVVLTLAATALAGCGGPTKFEDEPIRVFPPPPTRPVTSMPPVTAAPVVRSSTTTTRATNSTTARQPAVAVQPTTTVAPTTTVNRANQTILQAAQGPPGGAAGVILQPTPASNLVVEILEEPGAATNAIAVNRVLSDLRKYSGKPVTEVHTSLPAGSGSRRWTEEELEEVADRAQTNPHGNGRFVLRILSVRGQNTRSAGILAESFRGDTIATFPDRYASAAQTLITAVTLHEMGHILGLVDLYLNRGRADTIDDPAREGHSRNRSSVMYWAVDPSALGGIFSTASNRFDGDDERDLAAIRAGAAAGTNPR